MTKTSVLKKLVFSGLVTCAAVSMTACASKIMKNDQAETLLSSKEYDDSISIKEIPAEEVTEPGHYVRVPGPEPVVTSHISASSAKDGGVLVGGIPAAGEMSVASSGSVNGALASPGAKSGTGSLSSGANIKGKMVKAPKGKVVLPPMPTTPAAAAAAAMAKMALPPGAKHEPSMEDGSSYNGRRPIIDPFRVGEKVTLEVSYFSVVAGDMTIETRGFAEVNGRKSYRFAGTAKSTSVFAMFYAIEDWFETFVDFETLVPVSYALHVKETKQLREVRTLFDWVVKKARYFDKKINDEQKLEEKNEEWDLPEYSQNVFSAVYYLRTFNLKPGLKTSFRVAHEGKNLVLNAEVLRREKISTAAGEFNTVVIKPTISLDGKFSPVGDIFVWVTDDDRKLLVRIESKIKIGKVVGVAKSIEYGK